MTLSQLAPRDRDERRQTLTAIYAHLTATASSYHSIIISLNVMLVTSIVFLTGYLVAAARTAAVTQRWIFAAIPLLLGALGILVTVIVRRHYFAIASVIRRIDDLHGVFEVGLYIEGETLYPVAWMRFSGAGWREIIFDVFIPTHIFLGTVSSTLIALH